MLLSAACPQGGRLECPLSFPSSLSKGDEVRYLMAWADDNPIRGSNLSADPGANTEGRAGRRSSVLPSFGIGTKTISPSARSAELYGQEKIVNTGRRSPGYV